MRRLRCWPPAAEEAVANGGVRERLLARSIARIEFERPDAEHLLEAG
jgi:hypothetical protein